MANPTIPEDAPIRQIKDWPSFLEQVRRRPGMWLGTTSIAGLHLLLQGFSLAEFVYDIPAEKMLAGFPFEEFEKWADSRFNPRRLSINSFGMAGRLADSEEGAFTLWFEWYDQFRREQGST